MHLEIKAVADFNMNGVKGSITFRQSLASSSPTPVNITVQLQGAGLAGPGIPWHVHEFPLSFTTPPSEQCSAASVGGHFDPFLKAQLPQYANKCASNAADCEVGDLSGRHGQLEVSASYEDRFISLTGRHSIVGRSVVIHRPDGTRWVCANILPANVAMKTAVARFNGPVVGGTITIRQPANDAHAESSILLDVYRTDGAATDTFDHNWHVHVHPVRFSNDTVTMDTSTRCLSAGDHYDPLGALRNPNYATDCSPFNPQNCEIGDLSAKQAPLNLLSGRRYRAFYTDSSLPLSGSYSVIGRSIVVHDASRGAPRISCADITELHARKMSATFDSQGVKGVMTFSQASPWDPTHVSFGLSGLAGLAGGYHVHEFPRSVHGAAHYPSPCSAQEVGGHLNPFNAPFPAQVPTGFERTDDLYEVGDLSGKFGSLNGLQDVEQEHVDGNLPLFGPHSIAGRSIVIHRNAAGAPRWVCTNIGMPQTARNSATARLLSPLAGMIYFRQIDEYETSVFVDLRRVDGQPSSRDHLWQVAEQPVGSDQFAARSRCQSAQSLFNPFQVVPTVTSSCSPQNQYACPLGDMAAKSATLNFRETASTKFVYTDSFLPLQGQDSIIGHSVVIEAPNRASPVMACATIEPFAWRRAQASFGSAGVSGFVSFRQRTPLSPTVTSVQLSGLEGRASEYALHYLPAQKSDASGGPTVSPMVTNPCTEELIGKVYNPTSVSTVTMNTQPTADKVAVGGLSSKFGSLQGLSGVVSSFADEHHMPMTGPLNFVGRSVSLHRASDNAPFVCSTVRYLGGRIVTAVAKFTGALVGEIRFQQIDNLPTQITIQLQHGQQMMPTLSHRWAIHSKRVNGDHLNAVGRCLSASAVYNPANVSFIDIDYESRCASTPAACQLGDMWYKHGVLSMAGSQQRPYTVVLSEDFLPLYGRLSGKWLRLRSRENDVICFL